MVKQYPHILRATVRTATTQDGNGNWIPGGSSQVEKECRFEPASNDVLINGPDGQQIAITGIVYLPLPAVDIQPGTAVEVLNGATVLLKNSVKRSSVGQLNHRLWL